MIGRGLLVVLLYASVASAATYYVDPSQAGCNQGGTDTLDSVNAGTSTGAAWCSVPGSRRFDQSTTTNSGFVSPNWGALTGVDASHRVACGDTILLKGGAAGSTNTYSTSTVGAAGTLCIAGGAPSITGCAAQKFFYPSTCTKANPITIKIASNAEWTGSQGNFTIDCSGMTPKGVMYDDADNDFNPCVALGSIGGIIVKGISATQRIEIKTLNTPGSTSQRQGGLQLIGVNGAALTDFEFGWLWIHDMAHGNGMGLGEVQQVQVHDVELSNNGSNGFNCGFARHHNCNGVGLERVNIHHNATIGGTVCASFGDAIEEQGAQNFWLLDSDVHDNGCTGMNVGAGDHVYPYANVVRVRDTVFRGNGTVNDVPGASNPNGYQGGGDSVPAEGAPASSPYDNYGILERVIAYGNSNGGLFIHHGSGFSMFLNALMYANAQGFNGYAAQGSGYQWDSAAADNGCVNCIMVRRSKTLINRNNNSLLTVCDQRCSNAGVQCATDTDCLNCVNTSRATCSFGYAPKPVINHSILVPQAADTEQLSDFTFKCATTCGNARASCYSGSDCTGCTGGCTYCQNNGTDCGGTGNATTFQTPPAFLTTGGTNLIGLASVPAGSLFVATPTTCACLTGAPTQTCDFTTCDFHPASGAASIDAGTYYMRANGGSAACGGGSPCTTLTVKQEPNLVSLGVNYNGHLADPHYFFKAPADYLNAVGDTIQIQGATSCAGGQTTIVSMTATTITISPACTWSDNAGIALPWLGSAPDIGPFESGGTTSTSLIATTTTSTSSTSSSTLPRPTTTSTLGPTTTSSTVQPTTTSTLVGATTTTTLPGSRTFLRGGKWTVTIDPAP